MGEGHAEIDLEATPAAAWAVVGDFGGVGGWFPGLESCVVDGDDRILSLMGMEVTERLERRDDDDRVLVYRIVAGVPVINHRATMTVRPAGSGCTVAWDVEVEPDDWTAILESTYQQALDALKAHLGG